MPTLPSFTAEHLNGQTRVFPTGEACILVFGFDKLHYSTVCDWYVALNDKTQAPVFIVPFISDRFMLMKDVLFEGLKQFFKQQQDVTCPAFINRIRFFKETGLDENQPLILKLAADGTYRVYSDPASVLKA